MSIQINLQTANTQIELSVGSAASPCINLQISLVEDASDIVFANDDPVASVSLNLEVSDWERYWGRGSNTLGRRRQPNIDKALRNSMAGRGLHSGVGVRVGDHPAGTLRRSLDHRGISGLVPGCALHPKGPFSHRKPETWMWEDVANDHLVFSRVEFRFSRQS